MNLIPRQDIDICLTGLNGQARSIAATEERSTGQQ